MTAITTAPAPAADGHLIPTFRATIGGASVLCCDARRCMRTWKVATGSPTGSMRCILGIFCAR